MKITKNQKIGIIIGGVLLLSGVGYYFYNRNKKNKLAEEKAKEEKEIADNLEVEEDGTITSDKVPVDVLSEDQTGQPTVIKTKAGIYGLNLKISGVFNGGRDILLANDMTATTMANIKKDAKIILAKSGENWAVLPKQPIQISVLSKNKIRVSPSLTTPYFTPNVSLPAMSKMYLLTKVYRPSKVINTSPQVQTIGAKG